jgi:hypothetical protein
MLRMAEYLARFDYGNRALGGGIDTLLAERQDRLGRLR